MLEGVCVGRCVRVGECLRAWWGFESKSERLSEHPAARERARAARTCMRGGRERGKEGGSERAREGGRERVGEGESEHRREGASGGASAVGKERTRGFSEREREREKERERERARERDRKSAS